MWHPPNDIQRGQKWCIGRCFRGFKYPFHSYLRMIWGVQPPNLDRLDQLQWKVCKQKTLTVGKKHHPYESWIRSMHKCEWKVVPFDNLTLLWGHKAHARIHAECKLQCLIEEQLFAIPEMGVQHLHGKKTTKNHGMVFLNLIICDFQLSSDFANDILPASNPQPGFVKRGLPCPKRSNGWPWPGQI